MSYKHLVEIRDQEIFGETHWTWIKSDSGAFDGPRDDWDHHQHKYFTHLNNRRVCITAGGNCGMYARFYSKIFETTYVFEPDTLNFHCLVNNTQSDNVYKFNCALSDKVEYVSINRSSMHNVGMHRIHKTGNVPTLTIDMFDFPIVDFIQLDVEGYEERAIRGAINTINKHKPVIVVERNSADNILKELGYHMITKSGHGDYVWVHTPKQ